MAGESTKQLVSDLLQQAVFARSALVILSPEMKAGRATEADVSNTQNEVNRLSQGISNFLPALRAMAPDIATKIEADRQMFLGRMSDAKSAWDRKDTFWGPSFLDESAGAAGSIVSSLKSAVGVVNRLYPTGTPATVPAGTVTTEDLLKWGAIGVAGIAGIVAAVILMGKPKSQRARA